MSRNVWTVHDARRGGTVGAGFHQENVQTRWIHNSHGGDGEGLPSRPVANNCLITAGNGHSGKIPQGVVLPSMAISR